MRNIMTPRRGAAALLAVLILASLAPFASPSGWTAGARQAATPGPDPCAGVTAMATPGMDRGTPMPGMAMGEMASPAAMPAFDQLYIDMMIPHHAAIIAMAEAALPRLTDARLREIAQAVIATQAPEIAELRELRQQVYGDPDPAPLDLAMMAMMEAAMPGMGSMEEMAVQMDSAAQVAAICAAENVDLAFIDLTIPHHETAITASEAALERAVHPEISEIARRVIAAQQQEIATLTEIRQDLAGSASPAADT